MGVREGGPCSPEGGLLVQDLIAEDEHSTENDLLPMSFRIQRRDPLQMNCLNILFSANAEGNEMIFPETWTAVRENRRGCAD